MWALAFESEKKEKLHGNSSILFVRWMGIQAVWPEANFSMNVSTGRDPICKRLQFLEIVSFRAI